MSFVDALFDREHDRIHVVERINGERVYREYPANYVFYYEDPRGKFSSIYGTPVSRFSSRNNKEFRKELRIQSGKKLFESDINPVFRCLEENYKDQINNFNTFLRNLGSINNQNYPIWNQEAIDNFELDEIEINIDTKLTDEDFNQLI